MEEGSVIVTIGCDSGQRHLSRFWNKNYVSKYNLKWPQSSGSGSSSSSDSSSSGSSSSSTSNSSDDVVVPAILKQFYF